MWKHIFTNHNFYITNCDIKLCQNKLCQNWCSQHYSYLIPIILFHSEKEGHKDRRVKSKWELAYNLTRRGNGGNHKLVMVRGGREWKLAIERSVEEATKGCLFVILECLQTLLTGGLFIFYFFLASLPSSLTSRHLSSLSLSLICTPLYYNFSSNEILRFINPSSRNLWKVFSYHVKNKVSMHIYAHFP